MKSLGGKMKTRWAAAFCLIMVLSVSLGGMTSAASPPATAGPREIQVTARDNGRAVDLKGEMLVVKLESNPSTGYGWQVQGAGSGLLRQVDATEWLPDTPGKLGGSGAQILRFAAVGKGQARPGSTWSMPAPGRPPLHQPSPSRWRCAWPSPPGM
jgi:inhibitor of cysteine peptidase